MGIEARSADRKAGAPLHRRAGIIIAIGCDTKHLDIMLCRSVSFEVNC